MEYFTSYENKSILNVEVTRVDPELYITTYKDLNLNIECFKVDPELDISVSALASNLDVEVTIKDSIILSVYKSTEDLCIICTLIPEEGEFYEVLLDVEGVIILKDGYNFNVKKDGLQS